MTDLPAWGYLDALVDEDPIKLRDVAWELCKELTLVSSQLAEARASGEAMGKVVEAASLYRQRIAGLILNGHELTFVTAVDEFEAAEARAKLTKEDA